MTDEELIERLRSIDHTDMEDCFFQSYYFIKAADRIEELQAKLDAAEAKLAKAVEALDFLEIAATGSGVPHPKERELLHDCIRKARTTLADLKGENDGKNP